MEVHYVWGEPRSHLIKLGRGGRTFAEASDLKGLAGKVHPRVEGSHAQKNFMFLQLVVDHPEEMLVGATPVAKAIVEVKYSKRGFHDPLRLESKAGVIHELRRTASCKH